jgi:2-pyrone-4,6-dicarboxylate lactonase
MTIPSCAPPDFAPRRPRTKLPAGAIDTHFHIFGPTAQFPYVASRTYTPPEASLSAYEHLAEQIGFSRAVIVQPSVYGTDNSRSLSVLRESRISMRAVIVIDDKMSDRDLRSFHDQGARGVRLNLLFNPGESFSMATKLADMIRDLGWHIQFLVEVSQITDLALRIDALRLPVVFDHFGHIPLQKGLQDPGFQDALALVRHGTAWVKLSGAYRITAQTSKPPYHDVAPTAQAFIAANADRILWGSDWPHPSISVPMPNDGDLADMAMSWVTEPALRQKYFVTNAEKLYGFEPI